MKDYDYDKLLHIKTAAEQGSSNGLHYYRYEPTPYRALEELFTSYQFESTDRVVDFGCGKGRLNFYIHHRFQAAAVGVEMNESFYWDARENLKSYVKKHRTIIGKIQFYRGLAERYPIHPMDNRFYFFNPFSVQIFMKVIGNILRSYEETSRELHLILYYPSEDYIYFLENETPFELHQQIILEELYEHNPYERFSIYRLGAV